ncbi:MAG: family 6 glucosyltransferase [Alphaproteobacteria bacterium]
MMTNLLPPPSRFVGIICFLLFFIIGLFAYSPPKIAVLYIATGRYIVFWPKFYESAQRHFLPQYEKHYFIFTDDTTIDFPDNVTRVERAWHPWPLDTLDRFEMFLSIQDQLKKYDYIYFFNANAEVVSDVGTEVFPSADQGIMVTWHPGYYRLKNPADYPYDRNEHSTAYIPMGAGKYYVQGGFNGGRTQDVLKMYRLLHQDVQENIRRQITARWHDESHLNHYILDKNPLVMTPNYIWATFDWEIVPEFQDKIKIRMRNKGEKEYGGVSWLRNESRRKSWEKPTPEEMKTGFYLKHKMWTDYLLQQGTEYCRFFKSSCATVEKQGNRLIVKWHNWPAEEFILNPTDGVYELKE